MGEWSNLTQREKSNIIRFAIKNGVSDINTIRDTFNVYISGNGGGNEYKEGGSIQIKHPGRLTALKERTGKTEAELWATGNAHTRKMITFARNARKWKHDDGGSLSGFSEYELERLNEERRYIENQKQWLQNWYAKRLPAIGKEHLQEYVDVGLGVPYKTTLESPTPSSPSMGANYHFSNDDYRNPSTIKEKGYDTGTGIYFYTYRPIGMLGFKQEKYSIPVHEFTHATQYGGSSIFNPEFTGGKNIGEFDDYLQRPDEQHARIMELRYENKLDPTKTDYTAEDIKNLKDPSGALQELRSGGMDDDAIINALNTWASNTESAFDLGNGKHISSTGGPLYPFSFQKNPYWKTPVVRYKNGGKVNRDSEFLQSETIKNVKKWLNKGTKFQTPRPKTVFTQNIVNALYPKVPDIQYVWDDPEHTSYSAFRRNPDYRAPAIPAINKGISPIGLNVSRYIEKAPGVHLSPEYILNNLPNFKIPPVSVSLPKRNNQNLKGNWIQTGASWNPAYGYETFHLENSNPDLYGIKYYSIPGAVNSGQGSSAVLDSTIMGMPIQELNNRIFDYRIKNGGWNSFSDIN